MGKPPDRSVGNKKGRRNAIHYNVDFIRDKKEGGGEKAWRCAHGVGGGTRKGGR
jgi:hypothetical protein